MADETPNAREPAEGEYQVAFRSRGALWSWGAVVLLCAVIVGWGVFNLAMVKDAPRQWDYGTLPDAPGQSIYSTQSPPKGAQAPPPQIAPLPEAKPFKAQ